MRKISKGTAVKAMSMGLAVAIAAGVMLNPVSGVNSKASEVDEVVNFTEEDTIVIVDEKEDGTRIEYVFYDDRNETISYDENNNVISSDVEYVREYTEEDDFLKEGDYKLTPQMKSNFENLENMTEDEFNAIFDTEVYSMNFDLANRTGTRGPEEKAFMIALKKLVKECGEKGVRELVEKGIKKLPKFVDDVLVKVLGKKYKQKLTKALIAVAKLEDNAADFLKKEFGIPKNVTKVLLEVLMIII